MRDVLTDALDLVGALALVVGVALATGALVASVAGAPVGVAAGLVVGGALLLALSWLVERPSRRTRREHR